jgi:uncharacterized protein
MMGMDKSRLEIQSGLWLDHRRAIFLEKQSVLAVADLHLGYAWAHRYEGQMMPLQCDGVQERLAELCAFYRPDTIAVLGDIVHRAVPVTEIKQEFLSLVSILRESCGVKLILGNHDKGLKRLAGPEVEFHNTLPIGRYLLVHGNEKLSPTPDLTVLMGHEHPAISLGDGVRSAKFPCFLVSPNLIILPAFSRWAAGVDVRYHPLMSPLAQSTRFEKAVAILGGKLLPMPLH